MKSEKVIIIDYKRKREALALLSELRIISDFLIYINNPKENGVYYPLGKGTLFALIDKLVLPA